MFKSNYYAIICILCHFKDSNIKKKLYILQKRGKESQKILASTIN